MSSECRCAVVEPHEDDWAVGLSGPPAFTIEGAQTSRVYWRSGDHFDERWGRPVVAYAAIGGDYIVLNEAMDGYISEYTLAHEYGHNRGFRHHDGTVMDSVLFNNRDGRGGGALDEVTRSVFEDIGGVRVCEWGSRGIRHLGAVSSAYARGYADIDTLGYAGKRYVRRSGVDVFYENLGLPLTEHDGVEPWQLLRGQFYTAHE